MSFKTWGNTMFKNFLRDESGASAAEYALILAVIGALIAGGASLLGTAINNTLTTASEEVTWTPAG